MSRTLAQLRAFNQTSFYQSAPGVLGGLATGFVATLIATWRGEGTLHVGNLDTANTRGWSLSCAAIPSSSQYSITANVYEGGVLQTLTTSIASTVGKTFVVHLLYTGTTLQIWVNGSHAATQATAGDPYDVSPGRFSIGNIAAAPVDPGICADFVGFGFGPLANANAVSIPANVIEISKRGAITSVGLLGDFTYSYNVQRDANNGAPNVLRNFGTVTPNGSLVKQGANVILSTPNTFFWGDAAQAAGGGGGGGGELVVPLDLYVAPTGDDTNDGLTPATPVLTLAGAYSKIPSTNLGASVTIHTAAFADLTWTPIPDYLGETLAGQIIIIGDGAGQGAEDGFTVVAAGIAGALTTGSSVDFAALADQYLGYTLEFTDGAAAGRRVLVRNNTTTEIIPTNELNPPPAPGDNFRILSPATIVDITGLLVRVCAATNSLYPTLINLAFDGGGGASVVVDSVPCLKMYGVLLTNGADIQIANSRVYTGLSFGAVATEEDIHIDTLVAAIPAASGWNGWGVSNDNSSLFSGNEPVEKITGFVVSQGPLETGIDGTELLLLGGYAPGLSVRNGTLEFRAGTGTIPFLLRATDTPLFALATQNVNTTVEGGDAALVFEGVTVDPTGGMIRIFENSEMLWRGPMTLDVTDIQGIVVEKSQFDLFLAPAETVTLNTDNSIGVSAIQQSKFNVWGNGGTFDVNVGANGGQVLVADSESEIQIGPLLDTIDVSTAVPGNYSFVFVNADSVFRAFATTSTISDGGLIANISSSKLFLSADIVNAIQGFVVFESEINVTGNTADTVGDFLLVNAGQVPSTVGLAFTTITTGGQITVFSNSDVTISGDIVSSVAANCLVINGSKVALGGSVTCIDGPILTNSTLQLDSNLICSGAGLVCTQGSEGTIRAVSANTDAVTVTGNSIIVVPNTQTFTSTLGTAFVINTGSKLSLLGLASTINAGIDGVNLTGGGETTFENLPTFVVPANNDIRVDPATVSAAAAALPAAGASFSNAGAGSVATRLN